jgi:hypothetical protein
MRTSLRILVVLGAVLGLVGSARAQFGRPGGFAPKPPPATPRPVVPPRSPAPPHFHPAIPAPHSMAPHTKPHTAHPAEETPPVTEADPSLAIQAASSVGLLGSASGEGLLLWITTRASAETSGADPMDQQADLPLLSEGPADRRSYESVTEADISAAPRVVAGGAILFLVFGGAALYLILTLGRDPGRSGTARSGSRSIPSADAGRVSIARVRIVAIPPGEAPERIREAWTGLELPITEGRSTGEGVGVISGRPCHGVDGYAVNGAVAVRLLAVRAPAAAAWWRNHAPHVLTNGYQFVFPAEVCETVS